MRLLFFGLFALVAGFPDSAQGEASIESCSATHEAILREHAEWLGRRIEELDHGLRLTRIAEVPQSYPERLKSRPQKARAAELRYERYVRELTQVISRMVHASREGIHIECRSARWDLRCRKTETHAFVAYTFLGTPIRSIKICPLFFKLPVEGRNEILMHELSHYAASTEDIGLDWILPERADITQAARDAYHIQEFADGTLRSTLRAQIWGVNWLLAPRIR